MNKNIFFISLSFFLFSVSNLHAKTSPSFDCDKASNEVEKLICSDDNLMELDSRLSNSYKSFISYLNKEDKNDLVISHEKWKNNLKNQPLMLLNAYERRAFHLGELYKERINLYNNSMNNITVWKRYKEKIKKDISIKRRKMYIIDNKYADICKDVEYFLLNEKKLNFIKFNYEGKNDNDGLAPFKHNFGISTALIDIDNDNEKEIAFKYVFSLPGVSSTKTTQSINYYIPLSQKTNNYDLILSNIYLLVKDILSKFNNNPEDCNNIKIYYDVIGKRRQNIHKLNIDEKTKKNIEDILTITKNNLERLSNKEDNICNPLLIYKILNQIPLGKTNHLNINYSNDLGAIEFFKYSKEIYVFVIP